MRIFFSVGEPSGDEHAAVLIEELCRRRPDIRPTGFGGPRMAEAGCELIYPLTELAVMGFIKVLPMLGRFYQLVKRAERIFRSDPPDAVVLVDFPGFNWWIARKAHAAGIPVFYYLPPQLWAWAPWRIRRVRRFVDKVLCGLPFEAKWYAERGVEAEYVGHPLFDELAERPLDDQFLAGCRDGRGPVVALLPGSRDQEVAMNWPVFLRVMAEIRQRHPATRFLVANYRASQRRRCEAEYLAQERLLSPAGGDSGQVSGQGRIEFHVGRTSEILEAADCCLMVSGSVSLEVLARRTPAVVVYRATRLIAYTYRYLATCRYISLPNLFADEELMPEFAFKGSIEPWISPITSVLDGWLTDPAARQRIADRLGSLYETVRLSGATDRTAAAILTALPGPTAIRRAA